MKASACIISLLVAGFCFCATADPAFAKRGDQEAGGSQNAKQDDVEYRNRQGSRDRTVERDRTGDRVSDRDRRDGDRRDGDRDRRDGDRDRRDGDRDRYDRDRRDGDRDYRDGDRDRRDGDRDRYDRDHRDGDRDRHDGDRDRRDGDRDRHDGDRDRRDGDRDRYDRDRRDGDRDRRGDWDPHRGAGISRDEARAIARQYNLGGYNQLPPGIAKNLQRGKPLPPGIAKKQVPPSMYSRLPSRPGYDWMIVGEDLILLQESTNTIVDVLSGVFR